MTPLRKMMLEELQRRNYSQTTTRSYLQIVRDFAKFFNRAPDQLGSAEIRTYQAHLLEERKLEPRTVSVSSFPHPRERMPATCLQTGTFAHEGASTCVLQRTIEGRFKRKYGSPGSGRLSVLLGSFSI